MKIPGISSGGVTGAIQAAIGNKLAHKQMQQDSKARRQGLYLDAARLGLGAGELANRVYQPEQNRQLQREMPSIQSEANIKEAFGLIPAEVKKYTELTPGVLNRVEGQALRLQPINERNLRLETEAKRSLETDAANVRREMERMRQEFEKPAQAADINLKGAEAAYRKSLAGPGGVGGDTEDTLKANTNQLSVDTLNSVAAGDMSPELRAELVRRSSGAQGSADPLGLAWRQYRGFRSSPPEGVGAGDLSGRGLAGLAQDPEQLGSVLSALIENSPNDERTAALARIVQDSIHEGSQGKFSGFNDLIQSALDAAAKRYPDTKTFPPNEIQALKSMAIMQRLAELTGERVPEQGPDIPKYPGGQEFLPALEKSLMERKNAKEWKNLDRFFGPSQIRGW
jgi:hypothetical protein